MLGIGIVRGVDGGIGGVIDTWLLSVGLDAVAVEGGTCWVIYADFSLLVLVGFTGILACAFHINLILYYELIFCIQMGKYWNIG